MRSVLELPPRPSERSDAAGLHAVPSPSPCRHRQRDDDQRREPEVRQVRGDQPVEQRPDGSRGGDRDDPRDHHVARDSPPHRGSAARRPRADHATGDGVRRRHRDAEIGRREQHDRPTGRGREALVLVELGDARAHRLDDPPPAGQRPEADRHIAAERHPVRHVEGGEVARRIEQHGDDPHRLLGIVEAVAERIGAGGNEMQPAKRALRAARAGMDPEPARREHDHHREHSPSSGDSTIAISVLLSPAHCTWPRPAAATPAPIRPPTSAWLDEEGMPFSHVTTFQNIAPTSAPNTTAGVTWSLSIRPFPIVSATL